MNGRQNEGHGFENVGQHRQTGDIMDRLTQQEIDEVYRAQQRIYWEADFVNRCIDRLLAGEGLCNLPYSSLADEKEILDEAYQLYNKKEDCNVAYTDTLDAVIDEIERWISNGPTGTPGQGEEENPVTLC